MLELDILTEKLTFEKAARCQMNCLHQGCCFQCEEVCLLSMCLICMNVVGDVRAQGHTLGVLSSSASDLTFSGTTQRSGGTLPPAGQMVQQRCVTAESFGKSYATTSGWHNCTTLNAFIC